MPTFFARIVGWGKERIYQPLNNDRPEGGQNKLPSPQEDDTTPHLSKEDLSRIAERMAEKEEEMLIEELIREMK